MRERTVAVETDVDHGSVGFRSGAEGAEWKGRDEKTENKRAVLLNTQTQNPNPLMRNYQFAHIVGSGFGLIEAACPYLDLGPTLAPLKFKTKKIQFFKISTPPTDQQKKKNFTFIVAKYFLGLLGNFF